MANRWGNSGKQWQTLLWGAPKSLLMVTAAMKLKDAYSLEKSYDQPRQLIKKQRHYFANIGLSGQNYVFSSSHLWMWELDIKKAECWRIDAFELWCWRKLLRVSDCKEIQPVHPKGNQSWIFIGRTDVEDETPILWPLGAKNWLIWKDHDAGEGWRQEKKATTEDEMVGQQQQQWTCLSKLRELAMDSEAWHLWGRKELETTERLNWNSCIYPYIQKH